MTRSSRRFLDHAAGSPLVGPALAAMAEVWELAGNPSSLHSSGRALRRHLEQAREAVAADLGAHPTEVVFCSGGTEANNLALLGAAWSVFFWGGYYVVRRARRSSGSHPARPAVTTP